MPIEKTELPARRRSPAQARGEERVDKILDAAGQLIAEVGCERLTLAALADRSESTMGSIYHFFSNKEQVVDALVERLAAELTSIPGQVLTPELGALPLDQFVHGLVERLAGFAELHPEIPDLMGRVVERRSFSSVDADIAHRLEAIIRSRRPRMAAGERRVIVRFTMELVRGGIRLIARGDRNARKLFQKELELALLLYLRSRIE